MLTNIGANCCGCGACADACPKHIIHMEKDDLGFLYPIVDSEKCVNCNRCNMACPNQREKNSILNVGAVECAYSVNHDAKMICSSGAIFYEIANDFIKQGGICFGAAFDQDFSVKHIEVDRLEDLPRILGSKYTQSNTSGIFKQVKERLKDNYPVLFVGTPCQVAALVSYLNKPYDNLYLVDLFCYGVPAPNVWRAWLEHVSKGRKVHR